MFNARVILQSTDAQALMPALDAFARESGLGLPAESLPSEASVQTHVWRRASADASLQDMRATFDAGMDCGYVEFRGDSPDGVAQAVATARERWPVRPPADLAREAISSWRTNPALLPCAALGVTDDTEDALGQAIFEALSEADDAIWNHAATAAALMPATQSHWLVGMALSTEDDEARRDKLERLKDYLDGPTGDLS
jgi:hypothetical protein